MAPRSNPGFLQVGRRRDNIIYFSQKGARKEKVGTEREGATSKTEALKKKKRGIPEGQQWAYVRGFGCQDTRKGLGQRPLGKDLATPCPWRDFWVDRWDSHRAVVMRDNERTPSLSTGPAHCRVLLSPPSPLPSCPGRRQVTAVV